MAQDLQEQEAAKKWEKVLERTYSDESFKQRLLADPRAVLVEAGIPIPPNVTVRLHESTPTEIQFVLPPAPAGREGEKLTDADLDRVSGGGLFADCAYCFFNPIGSFIK